MDREILGIDHGNRQMKTANTAFLSTVTQNKVKPSNLNQILEFKGKYYSIGGSREDVDTKVDKTVDDDYYILTLASLAAELKARGKNQAAVRLATGLPPRWYESQMKAFRKYLGRGKGVIFSLSGRRVQCLSGRRERIYAGVCSNHRYIGRDTGKILPSGRYRRRNR